METYKYLLDLAIILLCTKALGLATRKVTDAAGCRGHFLQEFFLDRRCLGS